jgi:hypothetical protein
MLNRRRRLIEIKNIEVTEEKLKELKAKTHGIDSFNYTHLMKELFGGYCCICVAVPYKIAYFKLGDARVIERYCLKCLPKINDNLRGMDEKIVIEYR